MSSKNVGARNGNRKLGDETVQQIRRALALGGLASQRALAAHFRVSQSTISDIGSGALWGHLAAPSPSTLRAARMSEVAAIASAFGGRLALDTGVVDLRPGELRVVEPDDDPGPRAA